MKNRLPELTEEEYVNPSAAEQESQILLDIKTMQVESRQLLFDCDYQLALPYTLNLLDIYRKQNKTEDYLNTFCDLVQIYEQVGVFPAYMECLPEMIEILTKSSISAAVARTNSAIGRLYHLLEEYDQALIYFNKSLEINLFLNEKNNLVSNYQYMAETYATKNEMTLALETMQKCMVFCNQIHDQRLTASCLNSFGDILWSNGQMNASFRKFTAAIEMARSANNPYEIVRALIGLGRLQNEHKLSDQALTTWQEAFQIAQRYKMHKHLAFLLLALAKIYKEKNSYKITADYFEMYIHENECLSLQSFANQLRNLETSQKIEIINRRNHQLRHEIQERLKNQAELEVLATTDPLTGLFNRRHFFTLTEHWCDHAFEVDLEISAMMIDIDHFKKVNDRYGHQAGDQVLIKVSQAIQNALRTDDILCRFGGEEFSILLPNTNLMSAQQVAERIRQRVEELSVLFEDQTIRITVSIGVADLAGSPKHSVMGLLGHADQALYKAKHKGRNRCAVFSEQKNAN